MYGADEIIVLVQYRSGICRRHLGKRAGPSRSIYRAVTGGHTVGTPKQALTGGHAVGTPKQARGAVLIPFPYSYKRSHRRQGQASAWGRVDPFTVQSRGVMPVGLEHRDRVGLFTVHDTDEQDYFLRGAKEAIYIRAHHPSLIRDGGRHRLPDSFDLQC
ncbi:hypothetical protein Bbelb_199340 [Branchiostoma belcheri]|nr:hypothetical protein Bbelb_199340 [Branchiostoma belcheri]